MKPIFLRLLLISIFPLGLHAQSVTGVVLDGEGRPIPAATVSLLQSADSSWVRSEVTGSDGRYNLSGEAGTYLLQAGFPGREPQVKACTISNAKTTLIDFVLSTSATNMSAVTVAAKRPMIEAKPGMMVVNAWRTAP